MRIVVHADGRTVRGNERQLLLIVQGLVERGHEVHVSGHADSDTGRAFAAAGARVSGVRPRGDLDPLSTLGFARWLARLRPHALLLTSWKRMVGAAAAARLARVPRVVMRVGGVHGLGGWLRAGVTRHALREWVAAVYVNSDDVARHLLAAVPGLRAGRVVRIPNAIRPETAAPADLRRQLGLPPDAWLALGVGGLERRKGFDIAVQALAHPGLHELHLVLAGSGPEAEHLRLQAAALGVADRLHLLGHRADVPALLRAVGAFVLPSRREGMPVALMEAMAAGLPAVAARAGGVAELLAGGEQPGGWIVPANDARALAEALVQVFADPAEAAARAAAAERRVLEEFTVERLVRAVEALLEGGDMASAPD